MRAMVVSIQRPIADASLQASELVVPDPGPGEVRVRVRACATCRTDLHVIEGDLPPRRLPIVPGHQVVGVVAVYVVTRDAAHRRLALELGAEWAGGADSKLPVAVDSAIVFAPAGELVLRALQAVDKGGTVALAGIHMTDVPVMSYERHLFWEKTLQSVTANTREDGEALLREAAVIPIRPHVQRYALADANRALADVAGDRVQGTAVLMVD